LERNLLHACEPLGKPDARRRWVRLDPLSELYRTRSLVEPGRTVSTAMPRLTKLIHSSQSSGSTRPDQAAAGAAKSELDRAPDPDRAVRHGKLRELIALGGELRRVLERAGIVHGAIGSQELVSRGRPVLAHSHGSAFTMLALDTGVADAVAMPVIGVELMGAQSARARRVPVWIVEELLHTNM
jgi:hypothetical protein